MTIERIDLGIEYLGGITKPTAEQEGKYAVVRLDSLGRPNLSYEDTADVAANDAFATALAPHLRGAGMTVDASGNLRPRLRPRYRQRQDYFDTGNATSGSIGQLGWNLLGSGTPAYSRLNPAGAASSAKGRLTTSGSTNDRTVLSLAMTESGGVSELGSVTLLQASWAFNAVLTAKRFFFGFNDDMSLEPTSATGCLGIYYDSAVSPNYQIIARSSSAGTPTVTAAAVPSNTAELITMYQATAGTWVFYIGNTAVGSISSGLPTTTMNVGFRLETLAASAKTHNIGYFGSESSLQQALNDDTFLEA